MESFINRNTESRAKANNNFGKRLTKDMNTNLYGKTMEDVKKEQKLVLNMINVLKGYLNLAFAEWKIDTNGDDSFFLKYDTKRNHIW